MGNFKTALKAIDYRTGKIVWEHELGIGAFGPQANGAMGLLSTAGGLVFGNDGMGDFVAYRDTDGKPLWRADLGVLTSNGPSTYMLDQKQYVIIGAGGRGLRVRAAMSRTPLIAAGLAAALATTAVAAPARHAAHPSFDGFWEHSATSHLPRDPTPYKGEAAEQAKAQQEKMQQGWVVSADSAYCLPAGMPFMMSGSEGFDLVQNAREIAILNEERPSPRHIYLDGRGHPDPDAYDPTSVGHSIGRWQGDTLVVDTIGFKPGSYSGFIHSDATHLTERYQLIDGGKHLKITYTWEDPKVLSKPWTYVYVLDRAPKDRYAQEYYCDPRDPGRTSSNPGGKAP